MILGFGHPGIVVSDLQVARDFYQKMFGFEVVHHENWRSDNALYNQGVGLQGSAATGLVLRGHNCYLELFEYVSPQRCGPAPGDLGAHELGLRHLCFIVDDVWQEWWRLQELGGYAMQEPVGDEVFGWVVYCRDPFGNIIELSTYGGCSEPLTDLPGLSHEASYTGQG